MEGHKREALAVCGNIYRMNAPHAKGYLYNPTQDGKDIVNGMYCDRVEEITPSSWGYFYSFKSKMFYNLDKPRSLAAARKVA